MSRDPSLLPEDMRGAEERAAARAPSAASASGVGSEFHIPSAASRSPLPSATPSASSHPVAALASTPASTPAPSSQPTAPAPAPAVSPEKPASPPVRNGNGRRNGKPRSANGGVKRDALPPVFSTPPPVRGKAFWGISLMPNEGRDAMVASVWVSGTAIAGIILALLLIGVPWFVLEGRLTEAQRVVAALESRQRDAVARAADAERDLGLARRTIARAGAFRELLVQHRSWVPFFGLLESRTLPSVRYEGFTADAAGNVILPVSAPSVRAAAEQIRAWQETPGVSQVETSGISSSTDELGVIRGVRLDMQLRVDPNVFIAPPLNAKQ